VGRTGAGKSTLISTLFRLVSPTHGRVHIDNVDISRLPLSHLRSRLAIIPQSPALFSASLRKNLDPWNSYGDHELWDALAAVSLTNRIQKDGQGLDLQVYIYI
jgi:ABC-type multidrug transport system fused ATPase/permease subunit